MTLQEQDSALVEQAIQKTKLWLTVRRRADADYIFTALFYDVCEKFREHNRRLSSLQVHEVADLEFEVLANGHAKGSLLIKQKS